MPPMMKLDTSRAPALSAHARPLLARYCPTWRSWRTWSSSHVLPAGTSSVSSRRSSASKTSTPRSLRTCTNAACSTLALRTQMTSSKSRSSAFSGVSRRCSRPGRWTMTLRSLPTSESTLNVAEGEAVGMREPCSTAAAAASARTRDTSAGNPRRRRPSGDGRLVPWPIPLAVVALGGNALLQRGQPATAANQLRAARAAAAALAPVAEHTRLVVTHGNGPQVGLLALKEDAYGDGAPYPLDVLDAESEGQIGYVVELELDNAIDRQPTVTVITRVLVDAGDPAFAAPTKFIGPVYDADRAHVLAAERGWTVKPDGEWWRRVVPSPDPKRIIQLGRDPPPRRRRLPGRLRRWRRRPGRRQRQRPRRRRGRHRQGPRVRPAGASASRPTCSCSPPTSTPSTPTGARPDSGLWTA